MFYNFLHFIRKHCSQHSLAILDVCLKSSFTDEVVLHSFSLMTLPGSSGVFRAPLVSRKSKLENKSQDTGCVYVSGYLIKLDTDYIKKQCVYCKINLQRDTCLSRYQSYFFMFCQWVIKRWTSFQLHQSLQLPVTDINKLHVWLVYFGVLKSLVLNRHSS